MLEEYPDVLTSKQVMQILTVSKELLYDLIRNKQIPAYRLGKKFWRFNKPSLIKYMKAMDKQEKAE